MKNIIKLVLFLFSLQILTWGTINSDTKFLIIGIVNLVVLYIWMYMDKDFDTLIDSYQKRFDEINTQISPEEESQQRNAVNNIISYITKHFMFSISLFILIFALMNNLIFNVFEINLIRASFWFVLFALINAKNIINKDVYIGQKRLFIKDFLFVISGFVFVFIFFTISNTDWYVQIPISIFFASFFYFIFLGLFGLNRFKKFWTDNITKSYIILDIIALGVLLYFEIPAANQYLTRERIVEKVVIQTGYIDRVQYKCDLTGEALSGQSLTGDISTGDALTGENMTGQILTGDTGELVSTGTQTTITNSGEQILTYKEVIPFLVKKYNLKKDNNTKITFGKLPSDSPLYNDFLIAYQHKIFGKNSNPDAKLKCANFMTLIGLADGWKLDYNAQNIFDVFWDEATKKGIVYRSGCTDINAGLTSQNLNF